MLGISEVAQRLRVETSTLVDAFRQRAKEIRGTKELADVIKPLDKDVAVRTAFGYFGSGEHTAIGIDGSMQTDELLEMFIFYANATAYRCPFRVSQDRMEFDLDHAKRDDRLSVSATVPLWIEDLPEATDSTSIDTDYQLNAISNQIPFAVMAMAELKTAYRAVSSRDARIVFMDRPLSGTLSPLARDYRDLIKLKQFSLLGMETPAGPLSLLDMILAYNPSSGEEHLPQRERFLPYVVIKKLLDGESHSIGEMAKELHTDERTLGKTLMRVRKLNSDSEGTLLSRGARENERDLQLTDYARDYWKRVEFSLDWVLDKVFGGKGHPLSLEKDKWLTTRDLNAYNALMIYELRRLSAENKVLIIGIAKDTASTELGRAVIPYASSESGFMAKEIPPTRKSDRSLLGILSTSDDIEIRTPWRTMGYDAIFTTLIFREGKTPILTAARRRAGMEGRFVRGYFQLRSLTTDPKSKSPVFLYDRFQNDTFDGEYRRTTKVSEMNKTCEADIYFEGQGRNGLDEMILLVLSLSDNPHVAEAFGHNQLLFLADKAVKAEGRQARPMLRGIVGLEIGPVARGDRMFNIARRFRDIRSESERARETGGEKY